MSRRRVVAVALLVLVGGLSLWWSFSSHDSDPYVLRFGLGWLKLLALLVGAGSLIAALVVLLRAFTLGAGK